MLQRLLVPLAHRAMGYRTMHYELGPARIGGVIPAADEAAHIDEFHPPAGGPPT